MNFYAKTCFSSFLFLLLFSTSCYHYSTFTFPLPFQSYDHIIVVYWDLYVNPKHPYFNHPKYSGQLRLEGFYINFIRKLDTPCDIHKAGKKQHFPEKFCLKNFDDFLEIFVKKKRQNYSFER